MSMTWPRVRGLNFSTMGRPVGAEMYSDGSYTGRVWFAPPTSWRVENAAGEVTYIENDTDEYRRSDDGMMVHSVKSPNRWVMTIGDAPQTLLTSYLMWPLEERGTEPHLTAPSTPEPVECRGRSGWRVRFINAASGGEVAYVIDAELGLVLSRTVGSQVMELANPTLDEDVDPALFEWTGPAREKQDGFVTPAQREYEEKMAALKQLPRPRVTWVPRTITAEPLDGDPRTGALELQVTAEHGFFTLRQWITDVGEPDPGWSTQHVPVRHALSVGPWTYEIRSHTPIDPDDCTRIIESIEPAALPAATPEQIRDALNRDAAAKTETEASESLGTGRRLDDYLGGRHGVSLLIRTDFTDDDAWRSVAASAMAPGVGDESDFVAVLTCIDNREYDGMTINQLLDDIGDQPVYYAFLADTTTITDPEHPILAVDTSPTESDRSRGGTVRVIPSQMWSIENNLSLANMDFEDFTSAAGPDGIYRGFA
ncbi:DUF6924 domain-containing protein [Rhodococcus sp. NPDC054953]